MAEPLNDNDGLCITGFNGLVLGHGCYGLSHEFAETAIDVDLSYGDIRPYNCLETVCSVTSDCVNFVSDNCCKGDGFYHACHNDGHLVVENGILELRSDPCVSVCRHGVPAPTVAPSGCGSVCNCGGENMVVRYAYVDSDGRIGPLSPPSQVTSNCAISIPPAPSEWCVSGAVLFAQRGGLSTASSEVGHLGFAGEVNTNGGSITPINGVGFPAYSEGWYEPPTGIKYLVRHKSGAYMGAKGKILHISHKSFSNLWDKYRLCFCREIVSVIEVRGRVLVFDGKQVHSVTETNMGFDAEPVGDACVKSHKQIAVDGSTIVYIDKDGPKTLSASNASGANAITSGGLVDDETMNPSHMRTLNQNWRIAIYNGRIHFANDDNAYVYNTTRKGGRRALTESSVVPDDYYTDCDDLYYLVDGNVMLWNPVGGSPCPYTYCTLPLVFNECVNMGGYRAKGEEYGAERTKVEFFSVNCCERTKICECTDILCEVKHITACQNMREMAVCYTGTDIISGHEIRRTTRNM